MIILEQNGIMVIIGFQKPCICPWPNPVDGKSFGGGGGGGGGSDDDGRAPTGDGPSNEFMVHKIHLFKNCKQIYSYIT